MELNAGLHLAYCTNIHRGDDWAQTFNGLEQYTLKVRESVCPGEVPYAIGLRLSAKAAQELAVPEALAAFKQWLTRHNCYVFTINGFPYGEFHEVRVKEQVYAPDWQTPERLAYTQQLFELLVELLPPGVAGSVSTVPCSFKAFIDDDMQVDAMVTQLLHCADHLASLSAVHGVDLHLGLEPEPLCYLERTDEVLRFFDRLTDASSDADHVRKHIGINYDTCHLAIQYEDPAASLQQLADAGIRLSKLHLSSALKVAPTADMRARLQPFLDPVYLHQVVARRPGGDFDRAADLGEALDWPTDVIDAHDEWRIHYHVPLHADPGDGMHTTVDHLLGVMDWLAANPQACSHLEFETYTWDVLPDSLKTVSVVDQLTAEYRWCLDQLQRRGLATA